MDIERANLLWS